MPASRPRVLLVDRDDAIRRQGLDALRRRGYVASACADGKEAMDCLQGESFDLVLVAVDSPDSPAVELIAQIRSLKRGAQILAMTDAHDAQAALEAVRQGAFSALRRPLDVDEFEGLARRALAAKRARQEAELLRRAQPQWRYGELIGSCEPMQRVFRLIEKVSQSPNTTVLITGESGTGKELVAREIHRRSSRASHPFVAISCTALQESILESELFGHEKGAFTDAHETKPGLFEVAQEGTLFLDEIGDMDLRLQGKLLRALEQRAIRRVGGTQDIRIDTRLIAATNRDLSGMVAAGRFREDLYYRLRVVPIHLPPLRERKEDILILAENFIAEFDAALGKDVVGLSPEAARAFLEYPWPGNIRELRNVLERVILLEDCRLIGLENLPAEIVARRPGSANSEPRQRGGLVPFQEAKRQVVEDFERRYLVELLTVFKGNVSQAARAASMERGSFQRLMRKYRLRSEDFRQAGRRE